MRILIADDAQFNRILLKDILSDDYEILEAADGEQALKLIGAKSTRPDLVLLDAVMPNLDGFDVLAVMNTQHYIDTIPVIMISAEHSPLYIHRAYDLGATDYITRPFDVTVVRKRVANTLAIYAKQQKLTKLVSEQVHVQARSNSIMVNTLSQMVEFRNGESGLHVLHVQAMTEILLRAIAARYPEYHLTKQDIQQIGVASALHDIGKIGVSEAILNKPGKLTGDEFELVKAHTLIGANMLQNLPFIEDEPLLRYADEICRWHHERWDGKGYPDGRKGDEIPLCAQVVGLADVYDALTSPRVYKTAYSHETAMQMIQNGECGVFNPKLLAALADCSSAIRDQLLVNSYGRENPVDTAALTNELLGEKQLPGLAQFDSDPANREDPVAELAHRIRELYFVYDPNRDEMQLGALTQVTWGLPQRVENPAANSQLIDLFGQKPLSKWINLMRDASPDEPAQFGEYRLALEGRLQTHLIFFRAIRRKQPSAPEFVQVLGAAVRL